ncbi:MAG: CDP-glucose 4,6-dehydratase [Prosthecobacter sp.]|uniref:CDP-glucose 4,6-dehydratase n=1 Tax=Prosthecobacter sp. TaxID=1965333 RepID=UPI0039003819
MFGDTYRDKKILVTGHTGFKGSWLSEWLLLLGARVSGYALDPPTSPALFDTLGLSARMGDTRSDIRDAAAVSRWISAEQPDLVFHLAAQPLVRASYDAPVETFATNALGTAHLLDAVRCSPRPCPVVVITTDKCYHNNEWLHGYRESDRLGGHDPYSASKACAELIVASYQKSFASVPGFSLGTARAGNVIGGGDWAEHRIVPDCMRALARGESIPVRNPQQTRPWQHVLEPLSGYLWLGALLRHPELAKHSDNQDFRAAFNFGPQVDGNRPVKAVVEEILKHWSGAWHHLPQQSAPHEAGLLNLSIDKAYHLLQWQPAWQFEQAVQYTTEFYQAHFQLLGAAAALIPEQIRRYHADAAAIGLRWTA